jgi:hypothetical protein
MAADPCAADAAASAIGADAAGGAAAAAAGTGSRVGTPGLAQAVINNAVSRATAPQDRVMVLLSPQARLELARGVNIAEMIGMVADH